MKTFLIELKFQEDWITPGSGHMLHGKIVEYGEETLGVVDSCDEPEVFDQFVRQNHYLHPFILLPFFLLFHLVLNLF